MLTVLVMINQMWDNLTVQMMLPYTVHTSAYNHTYCNYIMDLELNAWVDSCKEAVILEICPAVRVYKKSACQHVFKMDLG